MFFFPSLLDHLDVWPSLCRIMCVFDIRRLFSLSSAWGGKFISDHLKSQFKEWSYKRDLWHLSQSRSNVQLLHKYDTNAENGRLRIVRSKKNFIFIDSRFFNERGGGDVFRRLQTFPGGRRLPSQELTVYDSFSSLLTFLTPRPCSVEFSQVSSNCSGSLPQSKDEHESRLLLWISHKCERLSFCVSCTRQYIGTSHCQTIWSYVVWLRIRRLWV